MKFNKLDYCQFLLGSQVNYTLTCMADHRGDVSHDKINRYLSMVQLRPRHLWERVAPLINQSEDAYLVFDDTVLDKSHGPSIELTQKQWSGNEKRTINGIGLIGCLYVEPAADRFWLIDYRIYEPERDGKTKLDHVADMFSSALARGLKFKTVLMDTWYATGDLMLLFDGAGKTFYCPLKADRQVDDSGGQQPYRRVDSLSWSQAEMVHGKRIKVRKFPKDYKVQLFRVVMSTHRTDYVVTNDLAQTSTQGTREVCAVRWKIEEMHRDLKQFTGIERCQCRKARIQRNHIHCAILVWTRLRQLALEKKTTVQQLKRGLLSEYLIQQLKKPAISMARA